MNFQEIINKLEELQITSRDMGNVHWFRRSISLMEILIETFGKIEIVDSDATHENEDSMCYQVYHFKEHGVYIKWSGFYSSYDGVDWDYEYPLEVVPKLITKTIYEVK